MFFPKEFFFIAHKPSKIAISAIIVTLEQEHLQVPPEAIESCLENIKAVVDFTKDVETMECIEHLRKIYALNELHIKAMECNVEDNDGGHNIPTNTDSGHDSVCCQVTPSTTSDDISDDVASAGSCEYLYESSKIEDGAKIQWVYPQDDNTNGSKCKRRRHDICR